MKSCLNQMCGWNSYVEGCQKPFGEDCPVPNVTKPMTNADRIRAMTDEELAEWIRAVSPYEEYCGCCPAEGFCNTSYKGMECKDIVRLWLQQPVKEGAEHEHD